MRPARHRGLLSCATLEGSCREIGQDPAKLPGLVWSCWQRLMVLCSFAFESLRIICVSIYVASTKLRPLCKSVLLAGVLQQCLHSQLFLLGLHKLLNQGVNPRLHRFAEAFDRLDPRAGQGVGKRL